MLFHRPIGAPDPDELGHGINQGTQFVFGLFVRGNITASIDELIDASVTIQIRRGVEVYNVLFPRSELFAYFFYIDRGVIPRLQPAFSAFHAYSIPR